MKHVDIYTDGACSGNPGPGGWGAILVYGDIEKELTGAIEALSALKEPCEVTLCTDSKYLADSVNLGWVYNWQKKGWKKSANEPTPNSDLWKLLLALLKKHKVEIVWVKGHAGHAYNERCDVMAVNQYQKYL